MHSLYLFNWIISITILVRFASSSSICDCANETLCHVMPAPEKVVLGFSTGFDNYKHYDWSRLNTIASFTHDGKIPMEFICYAHSHGVSVLMPPKISKDVVLNASRHSEAVSDILKDVQTNVVDGVNFDFELPLTSDEAKLYTMFVSETRAALHSINKLYQVSVDVAWSPDCIDGRCYDYIGLSQASDYLVIMAYDEQSQMPGPPCFANANSPFNQTASGIQAYFKHGVNESLLVLALPWYGYNYTCLSVDSHDRCQIQEKSYRNAKCSDAAGHQLPYSHFMKLSQDGNNIRRWNSDAMTPFFMVESLSSTYQLWYDDPISLAFKYEMARSLNLRGIALFNIDAMDYSDTPQSSLMRLEMWEATDVFL